VVARASGFTWFVKPTLIVEHRDVKWPFLPVVFIFNSEPLSFDSFEEALHHWISTILI
jgi:hypothetical protein